MAEPIPRRPAWLAAVAAAALAAGYGGKTVQIRYFPDGELPTDADAWECRNVNGQNVCSQKAPPDGGTAATAEGAFDVTWACAHVGSGPHDASRGSCPGCLCEPTLTPGAAPTPPAAVPDPVPPVRRPPARRRAPR